MLAIGLMSGTSLDGIDASLIESDGENEFKAIADFYLPYDKIFQSRLSELINAKSNWFDIEIELTQYHFESVKELLNRANIDKKEIKVIGFHGQTIYHDPKKFISWQIGNSHLLAKQTNIDVIGDFRRRDIVNHGQGAPLIPIFHKCLMQKEEKPVALLNIGGIANITYISDKELIAFDTGPGNCLINDAMVKYYDKEFDLDGIVAGQGIADSEIIEKILTNDFFSKNYPKSLDRNDFFSVIEICKEMQPKDIIATLTKLTCDSIIKAIKLLPSTPKNIYVCGGGVKNQKLMELLNIAKVTKFKDLAIKGYNSDFIESQGFAYIAIRTLKNLPSTFSSTTGINQETFSGVFFQK